MAKCEECPLYTSSRVNCMPGDGPLHAEMVLIGEAPGAEEERLVKPFMGAVGIKLNQMLQAAGISRKTVYIDNAVKCRPFNNEAPSIDQIRKCQHHLLDSLKQLPNMRVVVLMGNVALQSVLGYKGITKFRGNSYENENFPGVVFVPTLHPAAILRRWEDGPLVIHDLTLAKSLLGESKVEIKTDYRVLKTVDSVRKLRNLLLKSKEFAYDLETSDLDWATSDILCIGFSTGPGRAFVVPIKDARPIENPEVYWTEEERKEVFSLLRDIFESNVPKITQNGKFDTLHLRNAGVRVKHNDFDTLLAHHLVEENLHHGLKFLATLYTDMGDYEKGLLDAIKTMAHITKADPKTLWHYNCCDADATFRVALVLRDKLREEGVDNLFRNLSMPLNNALIDVEARGILVDRGVLDRNIEDLGSQMDQLEVKIIMLSGIGHFNINSSSQLCKVLTEQLGVPLPRTEKGNLSATEKVLTPLAKKYPICESLLEWRSISKLKNTYLEGEKGGIKRFIRHDGRVHPSYFVTGTVTGRLSCREPAIQTIPRESVIRHMFTVPPGYKLVEADYKNAELRVLAFYSKDVNLNKAFNEGRDLHTEVAANIFGIPAEKVSKEQRVTAKTITFGLNYGRGAVSIAEQLSIGPEEAKSLVTAYFKKYPGVYAWMLRIKREVNTAGVLTTVFGRKRRLYGALDSTAPQGMKAEMERNGISALIQSTASEVLSYATVRIHKRLEGMKSGIILTLHDALFVEAHESELENVLIIVKEEMERPVPEMKGYFLPVDISVGNFWGDGEE